MTTWVSHEHDLGHKLQRQFSTEAGLRKRERKDSLLSTEEEYFMCPTNDH